jgi:hypothetical protein
MRMSRSAVMLVGATSFFLCACSVDDAGVHTGGAATGLPPGIGIEIHQNRTDLAARALQVAVTNSTDNEMAVESVVFRSEQFETSAVWQKDRTTIAPGITADLPVSLGTPRCDEGNARPQVDLTYRLAGGGKQTVTVDVVDHMGQLAAMKKADCLMAEVNTIVAIEASGPLKPTPTGSGGEAVAHLDLTLVPTGANRTVTIVGVRSTTLLTVAGGVDAGGVDVGGVDVGSATPSVFPVSVLGTDPPRVLTLEVRPARCDEHALAEDKRGTILPVNVETGGTRGKISIETSPTLRAELYEFVRAACASP